MKSERPQAAKPVFAVRQSTFNMFPTVALSAYPDHTVCATDVLIACPCFRKDHAFSDTVEGGARNCDAPALVR